MGVLYLTVKSSPNCVSDQKGDVNQRPFWKL